MPPKIDQRIKGYQGYGLIQVFTGHGKGKTTASLGEALRAYGAGQKVGFVFFDKGGDHYSERKVLKELGIVYIATGRNRIEASGRFDFSLTDEDKKEGVRGLKAVEKMFDEGFDLIILDEINSTANLGIVKIDDVLTLLKKKPQKTEMILTGRDVPEEFLEQAHLVTEMKLQKHYFYSGVQAREGLDY